MAKKSPKYNQTVAFDGAPVFWGIARVLKEARAKGWKGQLNSADRRRGVAERFGKKSQYQLYRDYQNGVGNPANKPGFSTHELRGPQGQKLPWWRLGLDVTESDQLLKVLSDLGYKIARTYPQNPREYHHLNFTRNPAPRWRARHLRKPVKAVNRQLPRDLRLARRAKKKGARWALTIVREARRAGLPISLAYALVEQESAFRNIHGHDQGSILHGEPVTRDSVRRLLKYVDQGNPSNGCGLTQLTFPGYIREAEKMGGAHKPKYQCRVGFRALAGMIKRYGRAGGLAAYNAGNPNSSMGRTYAHEVMTRQREWHDWLKRA